MRRRTALATLTGCLLLAAPAAAQQPTATPTPTPTPTPITPAPTPAPVKAKASVKPLDTYRDGRRHVVIAGRAWRVSGTVRPYVAGQTVNVRVYRDGHRIKSQRERLDPSPDGKAGTFRTIIPRGRAGTYLVRVSHQRSAEMDRFRAPSVRVLVVDGNLAPGARGAAVRLLQRGLSKLHYVTSRSGVLDAETQRGILAWRKVTGRPRTFTASRGVLLGVLAGKGAWKVRHPKDGHHVEADLSLQVLALVNGSKVHRIYHISSGKPSTPTVLGRFHVYRKDPGTNAEGMVHSSYFIRGYAIHGYASVPTYNASHGCLRVPIPDSWSIYNWVRMGDVVWVEP